MYYNYYNNIINIFYHNGDQDIIEISINTCKFVIQDFHYNKFAIYQDFIVVISCINLYIHN